ncbi:DUF6542 domain-containing protein, partial [Streptomyces sp. MUM 2J]|uniref:DUF6542 domain-containing protein n=2 Tax=unclassified Streptomyces TaxID=2593676 RepID=UPI001F033B5E
AQGTPGGRRPAGADRTGRPAEGRGQRRPSAVRGSASPVARAVRRMPDPRLTGLGSGLFCAAVMVALGFLDQLLFGTSSTLYGVLFLPVCALTALWVRRGELLRAPVVVPIAFTAGLLPVAAGGEGVLGRLVGLVTALATQAGWLYGGTLVAGLVVIVRRLRQVRQRRRTAPAQRTAA